ncbi:RHS repeat-associated core domain-containing protein [Novosphingobium terrae]|uniref:RHS repeat-associated core domain-containing protein n=1 Tax=Novosphingobium terrae TaxID=2726189 RepID=UPI001981B115|nr:RHS repeat-associated core domain-containing protein [Novosphingobium terrae]
MAETPPFAETGLPVLFAPVDARAVAGWASAGQLYAMIDGCVSPDVPELAASQQGACLYQGWAAVSYRDKAPYLLRVDAGMAQEIARRFDGRPWGYFLLSSAGFKAVHRQLRRFIKVSSPEGEGWIFRFHDPRLLPAYLRSSTVEELNAFFGPLQAFLTVDGDGHGHMAYRAPEIVRMPPRQPVGARARISRAHVAAFRRRAGSDRLAGSFAGLPHAPRHDPASDDLLIDSPGGGATRLSFGGDGQVERVTSPLGRQWHMAHGDQGKLTALRMPSGLALDLAYDRRGNIAAVSRGGRERFRARHDAVNRLERMDFADGTFHAVAYRDEGRLAARDPQGRFITARRDRLGRIERFDYQGDALAAVSDGNGNSTRFLYGVGSQPEAQIHPDGARESYSFDPAGTLQQLIRADGLRIDLSRNAAGQVTRMAAGDGVASFDYDARGLLLSARNEEIDLAWRYDAQGRLIEERQGDQSVRYEYDAAGVQIGLVWPDGSAMRYTRDADQRLCAVTDWSGARHTLDYAPEEAGWRMLSPGGLVATTWQDQAGLPTGRRLETPDGTAFQQSYAYDAEDRLVAREDSRLGALRVDYDAEGQVLALQRADGASEQFAYDGAGNRIASAAGAARFNALNQMLVQGGETFSYDQRGNLVERSSASHWRYAWDGFERLIRAEDDHGLVVRFAYDPLGRRIRKEVRSGGTLRVTRMIWAGEQMIREIETITADGWQDHGTRHIRDYAYWPESYTPLFQRDASGICHYHVDPIGMPVRLTDAHGAIVWEAERTAFGALQLLAGGKYQPLRLPGQYHDAETGLHYNRLRYYDPAIGRYLSRDPMGAAGGFNLYAYVGNDPLNRADPLGLLWQQVASAVAAIAAGVVIGAILAPIAAPVVVLLTAGAIAGMIGFGLNEALTQKSFCLSCILLAAGKGALVGALAAVPFLFVPAAAGYAIYAGVGAVSGFVSYVADWGIDNLAGKDHPWSWKEAGLATGLGLVAGPAGKFLASRFAGKAPAEGGEAPKTPTPPEAGPGKPTMSMADAVGKDWAEEWLNGGRAAAARNKFDISGLSDDEVTALHGYTRAGYRQLNAALRGDTPMTPQLQAFSDHLDSGLSKLPSFEGTSYRGGTPSASVMDQYRPGNVVSDGAPKSTAADAGQAYSGRLQEVVIGQSGKDVSPLSRYPETEVLYPSNTKFEVLERTDLPNGNVNTVIREVP